MFYLFVLGSLHPFLNVSKSGTISILRKSHGDMSHPQIMTMMTTTSLDLNKFFFSSLKFFLHILL